MHKSARILKFPAPEAKSGWDPQTAERVVAEFLRGSKTDVADLLDADVLMMLCSRLREQVNVSPIDVLTHSSAVYETLFAAHEPVGLFDEREYVLGELALLAGKASRLLGKRDETAAWLDRADLFFRQTVNPAPHLSNVAYDRLALDYEKRNFGHVLEHAPALVKTFNRLGMVVESAKTLYLQAATLKMVGRWDEAIDVATRVTALPELGSEPGVVGQAWMEIGECHAQFERFAEAISAYRSALPLLEAADRPISTFALKISLGQTLRQQGHLLEALTLFQSASLDARNLGLSTNLAYVRLMSSEILLAMGRHREAEWEVRAAIPTIQEQCLVPEGLAALDLLKASLANRDVNLDRIRKVRGFLQQS